MSTKYESADLLLKLYDLRREETMRNARNWWFTFNPQSVQEIVSVLIGTDSAYFRMVASYWDMAASFVNNGAVDATMFNDANGEQLMVYAKVEPFIPELRNMFGPQMFANLEKLIKTTEGSEERLARFKENMRKWAAAREQIEVTAAQAGD